MIIQADGSACRAWPPGAIAEGAVRPEQSFCLTFRPFVTCAHGSTPIQSEPRRLMRAGTRGEACW